MTTVAVMQPYFFPYAGYYRLFAAADLFVIYDCVQFPRRGYVHRNRLPDRTGRPAWLTLPLEGRARETPIKGLAFSPSARPELIKRMRRFPSLDRLDTAEFDPLNEALLAVHQRPVDYLDALLGLTCDLLGLSTPRVRSSDLAVPDGITGASRILEICRLTGASRYVNAPGGRHLYDFETFRRHGVELTFLPDWNGPCHSVLHRLLTEPHHLLVQELTEV